MKEFADNNFKFDENGRKLSKQVENTLGKGEIACYEQRLLFPQCFQKACFPEATKGIVWEWVKQLKIPVRVHFLTPVLLSSASYFTVIHPLCSTRKEVNTCLKQCRWKLTSYSQRYYS